MEIKYSQLSELLNSRLSDQVKQAIQWGNANAQQLQPEFGIFVGDYGNGSGQFVGTAAKVELPFDRSAYSQVRAEFLSGTNTLDQTATAEGDIAKFASLSGLGPVSADYNGIKLSVSPFTEPPCLQITGPKTFTPTEQGLRLNDIAALANETATKLHKLSRK